MHIIKWKKANLKRLSIVWFQLYGILEKAKLWRQNICGFQDEEVNILSRAQWIWLRSENIRYDILIIDLCHYTFIQTTECTRVDPKINYGLWVIMMYQCGSILDKECTIQMSDVGESYAYVGSENIWEISVPTPQFCCKSKTALKNKVSNSLKYSTIQPFYIQIFYIQPLCRS